MRALHPSNAVQLTPPSRSYQIGEHSCKALNLVARECTLILDSIPLVLIWSWASMEEHKRAGSKRGPLDRLLTVKAVCEVLSTTDRSLRRWVHLGLVPPPDVRIGRNLRWRESTIRKLIDAGGTRKA